MTKRLYILIPVIALAAFATFYGRWATSRSELPTGSSEFARHPEVARLREEFGGRDGKLEALADIQSGHPTLKVSGCILDPSIVEFYSVCERRFGLKVDRVADALVVSEVTEFERSYNAEIWRHIEAMFGVSERQLLDETRESFWQKRRANQPPQPTTASSAVSRG